jgi:phage/plasmid-associated DNA primase
MRAAVEIIKRAVRDLDSAKGLIDEDLAKDVRNAETASSLIGILRIASCLYPLAIPAEVLDADPYLVNVENGTLDLRTGELRAHDPADLISKVAGCGYEPDAQGPVFAKFIAEVLPTADVREFVQRVFGYAMLGKVTEHVLPIFTGIGCNGKSTLVELVIKAFATTRSRPIPSCSSSRGSRSIRPARPICTACGWR